MSSTVEITPDWRSKLIELVKGRRTVMIVTERMRSIVGDDWDANTTILYTPDGERQKSWSVVENLTRELERVAHPRDGLIVGIGGGATTDLTGFVASLWMRGVDWIAVPTTLAAMVDAAIGGKTGINGEATKNLIGTFHLPIKTIIDSSLLITLPEREINAGLAEVLKCGFIADESILEIAGAMPGLEGQDLSTDSNLAELIERAVSVKERIVSNDFRERGERAFLNYGHTLGHAIERSMDYTLRHGEAVAIGMVFAACLSKVVHGHSDEIIQRHVDLLHKFHLPVLLPNVEFRSLLNLMWRDKKVKDGKLRFVTLRTMGNPVVVEVTEDQLNQAFDEHSRAMGVGL